jgi:hypothetical protein
LVNIGLVLFYGWLFVYIGFPGTERYGFDKREAAVCEQALAVGVGLFSGCEDEAGDFVDICAGAVDDVCVILMPEKVGEDFFY